MIREDIKPGYAPKEISFRGYTTKNLHHSADAARAFQDTIDRVGKQYPADVLSALKHTDDYMKLNDLHLEQGKAPDESELKAWRHAHTEARNMLNKVGEFMHHEDYWHMHEHEIQDLETNYTPETAGAEMADSYIPQNDLVEAIDLASLRKQIDKHTELAVKANKAGDDEAVKKHQRHINAIKDKMTKLVRAEEVVAEELTDKTIKSGDKVKVARVIADMLGVDNVETMSPDVAVNVGLRKVKNKRMTPELVGVVKKMLALASEVGIKVDQSLVPKAVSEETISESTQAHKVSVTVSDPNHTMVTMRKEKILKNVIVRAGDKGDAQAKAEAFYKKRGYKVHGSEYHSLQPATSLKTEEVINELKRDTLKSYIAKSMGSKSAADFTRGVKMAQGSGGEEKLRAKSEKRSAGIHTAIKKLSKEEVEQVDEISKNTLTSYIGKATTSVKNIKKNADVAHKRIDRTSHDYAKQGWANERDSLINKATKRASNIGKAAHKLATEEIELEEAIKLNSKVKIHAPGKDYHGEVGHVGEIRHGAYKGAPKTYMVDYGDHKSVQLGKERIKLHKEELDEGQDYSVTVTHYADGKHTPHEYIVKNANDRRHAKHIAMQKHEKKIGGLKQGEQYGASNNNVKELQKEEVDLMEDLQSTIAKHLDKHISDFKNGHTGMDQFGSKVMDAHKKVAAEHGIEHASAAKAVNAYVDKHLSEQASVADDGKTAPEEDETDTAENVPTQVGHTMQHPADDQLRRRKVMYKLGEWVEMQEGVFGDPVAPNKKSELQTLEDLQSADYKTTASGHKYRARHINFAASRGNASPVEGDDDEEQTQKRSHKSHGPLLKPVEEEVEDEYDGISTESDLDDMVKQIEDEEDILDAYDDNELVIVDDETGEIMSDVKEEVEQIDEVLSRAERMRAKMRFARTSSKRERRMKVVLKTRSSSATINKRARRLAINLIKQRIMKKPASQLTVGEKERVERMLAKRKNLINRLSMKLAPRVRKIENERLSHSKVTK